MLPKCITDSDCLILNPVFDNPILPFQGCDDGSCDICPGATEIEEAVVDVTKTVTAEKVRSLLIPESSPQS